MSNDWRDDGVKIIPSDKLDTQHAANSGHDARGGDHPRARRSEQAMGRNAWRFTPTPRPGRTITANSKASFISSAAGRACAGASSLEFVAEAGPGDFIFVPPFVPHQEINAVPIKPLICVVVRSGQEPVVVNLEIARKEAAGPKWLGSIRFIVSLDRNEPHSSHALPDEISDQRFDR